MEEIQERVEKLMHPALGSGGHDVIAKYSDRGMMDSMPKKKFVFKKKEVVAEPVAEPAEPKKKFQFKKKENVDESRMDKDLKYVYDGLALTYPDYTDITGINTHADEGLLKLYNKEMKRLTPGKGTYASYEEAMKRDPPPAKEIHKTLKKFEKYLKSKGAKSS
jgi:hypothetical protein